MLFWSALQALDLLYSKFQERYSFQYAPFSTSWQWSFGGHFQRRFKTLAYSWYRSIICATSLAWHWFKWLSSQTHHFSIETKCKCWQWIWTSCCSLGLRSESVILSSPLFFSITPFLLLGQYSRAGSLSNNSFRMKILMKILVRLSGQKGW